MACNLTKEVDLLEKSLPSIVHKRAVYITEREHQSSVVLLLLPTVAKSKPMTQWDIMVKRMHEASRLSMSLQDKVHELD